MKIFVSYLTSEMLNSDEQEEKEKCLLLCFLCLLFCFYKAILQHCFIRPDLVKMKILHAERQFTLPWYQFSRKSVCKDEFQIALQDLP